MAKNRNQKKPKQVLLGPGKKVPRLEGPMGADSKSPRTEFDDPSDLDESPVWQFHRMDIEGAFGWGACTGAGIWKVRERLAALERQTWRQILQDRKNNHYMTYEAVGTEAKRRLEHLRLQDDDRLFSIRVEQAVRVWGLRDARLFLILWWDPEHKVYPMNIANN